MKEMTAFELIRATKKAIEKECKEIADIHFAYGMKRAYALMEETYHKDIKNRLNSAYGNPVQTFKEKYDEAADFLRYREDGSQGKF